MTVALVSLAYILIGLAVIKVLLFTGTFDSSTDDAPMIGMALFVWPVVIVMCTLYGLGRVILYILRE